MTPPRSGALGRREPTDFRHVEKYPLSAVRADAVAHVEDALALPSWHWTHDQGREGSCVGHAVAMERAISNSTQNRLARLLWPSRRYDPLYTWDRAKERDEWDDTNPGDENGTSVRAAYDAARDLGMVRVRSMRLDDAGKPYPVGATAPLPAEGVSRNRWARNSDEIRTAIALGIPVVIGVNWYSGFDDPQLRGRDYFLPAESALGRLRGGHAVCIYGASDRRQAFKVKNSWGRSYPLVWLPYTTMERLLEEYGEAALVTDR